MLEKSRFKFFEKRSLRRDPNQLCCQEEGEDNLYKVIQAGKIEEPEDKSLCQGMQIPQRTENKVFQLK